ncbi:MAG: exo-alpha-sialidase, partial [Pirellulales bacterium]|nr:exo-alpha-sialidase [Pirellulales bacterium]
KDGHMAHKTCEEPVVVELKDRRLLSYISSTCGRIIKSYSEDGGEHWMKVQPTDIAMSNSPCAMKSLPGTGDLVLVWNMMSADEICQGSRRGRLCIAISKDDGDTW